MRTPEEIKEGMEQCANTETCENCGYRDECRDVFSNKPMTKDALAYIQQLESRLAQVERERDAAVEDLSVAKSCKICKNYAGAFVPNICMDCIECCNFEWRGVCAENTKEE